jgi:hypothetical protein
LEDGTAKEKEQPKIDQKERRIQRKQTRVRGMENFFARRIFGVCDINFYSKL